MKPRILRLVPAAALLLSLGLAAPTVRAQQQYDTIGAYYSPSLKAQFRVEELFLPQYGYFTAVRIVSEPDFDSPLRSAGLTAGDVITRLDGIRVTNLGELERHYDSTLVRYFKSGTQYPREARIFIGAGGVLPPQGGPIAP
jgi:hypothetical protein